MPAFVVCHEAWYWSTIPHAEDQIAEVSVMSHATDGVDWEFGIVWKNAGREDFAIVKLYDDAWRAWLEIPEFFGRLALLEDKSPAGVVAMLEQSGFEDATTRYREIAPTS